MKEIILYETIDGNIFTDKLQAMNHESYLLPFPSDIKEPPHKKGVYKWTCKVDGKCYIGKAEDLNNRFWDFVDALKGDKYYSGDKVTEAIKKYPLLSNWKYEVLQYVEDSKTLCEAEKIRIKEVPNEQTLNIQYAQSTVKCNGRFNGCKSNIKLTEDEYALIDKENKRLGKKYGFTFRLNWSLMNLSLGKKEISKDTVRHIPNEIGDALTFSVSDSTCYKQISDIGDRKHGYYAKIVHKGILSQYGPYETKEDCKKKYVEEKLKIIKGYIPKYENVMSPDIVSILNSLTTENAMRLQDLR